MWGMGACVLTRAQAGFRCIREAGKKQASGASVKQARSRLQVQGQNKSSLGGAHGRLLEQQGLTGIRFIRLNIAVSQQGLAGIRFIRLLELQGMQASLAWPSIASAMAKADMD